MARIAGVDIPRDKRLVIALTYIYGIGPTTAGRVCQIANVNPDARVKTLGDEEVGRLREVVDKQLDLVLLYKGDNIKGTPTRGDLKEEYKKYKHHPHLHHALHELKHAHHQLKETKHNFDGHKENAIRDVHAAIQQIEILLKHHKK